MTKRALTLVSALSLMGNLALAEWFTNDLTDAASVASDFDEYVSSHANSSWSHVASGATDQNGAPNTELTGGAILDWVTADDDTARSYLGTIASDWLDKSWTAHIAIEAPSSTTPYIFFGLGDPTPNESASNEPRKGDSTYVYWRSGSTGSKVSVKRNGITEINTGAWQGDPGYDMYMTYNHLDQTVRFEIDNWNGGRFSGVNVDTGTLSVDGYFSNTNDVHIFFGANAKVTFGEFYVKETFQCVHPGIPLTIEDLDAVKARLAVEPWATGYAHLLADGHASTNYVMRGPFETVSHAKPGQENDGSDPAWENDMEAIHCLARMWYFTEEDAYAQKGRDILISWATNQTLFAAGETYLEMGYNAWRVFEGADILRGTWPGWTDEDTEICKTYFENVYWDPGHVHVPYPLRSANQGAANLAAAVGVAIFNDDEVKFNQCLQAFRAGPAGALMDSLCNGQVGDSGRDSHSNGQIELLTWIAEAFWKQGVDVYAEHDNRLLAAGEYYSRVAMGLETPFVTAGTVYDIYSDNNALTATNATYFHGAKGLNKLHAAYVLRKGLSAPYLEEYLACFEQTEESFTYLKAVDTSTAVIPAPLTEPAPVASVTSLNGANMGDCTSGNESYSSGTWTVSGRGTRLYYSSDPDYRFAYLPVTGDATIIAQLIGLSGGSATDARAGLVFNESMANNDTMAAVVITAEDADDELQTWYRGETAHSHDGGDPVHGKPNQPRPRMPYWLKIERVGERVTLFTSPDGASWSTAGVADYEGLADTAYFGLAVSSDEYGSTATATFTDVRITGGDGGEASTVPEAPFAIYASPGGTEVPLRWLESFEADSYKIWKSTISGGPYTLLTQETGTSFVDTNVVYGTRYYYAVSAVNTHGESAKSPEETFQYRANHIEAEDYDGRGGNAREVGGCSDWCGGDKVGFINDGEWNRYDNIQIGTGSVFRARVATGSTNATGKIEVRLDSSTGTLIGSVDVPYTGSWDNNWNTIETALDPVSGTRSVYLKYVETTAAGVTGAGLFDVNWFGFINTNIAPDHLAASVSSASQLDLTWSPVAGATEYVLKRSLASGGPYTEVGTFLDTGFSDAGLIAGAAYYYVVTAIIDGQETVNSAEVMAVPEGPPPPAVPFFTNTLTDAASVALDFNEYISSVSNAVWSYTNGYMVTDSGTTNTVLEGGAVIDWVTVDDDTARSYLGTIHSNYLGKSWTAHIGMEAPNAEKPYYFFGLGNPTPNEAGNRYHEPRNADTVYLKFQTGNRNSDVKVYNDNGDVLYDTEAWRGDPGYDIWMTYNHVNQTIQFDLDDWNGGRYSDIDLSTPEISIAGQISDTNMAHIFFGSNAKVCFRDFDVVENDAETPPAVPQNVYTVVNNMAVSVNWDAAGGADSYDVKRSATSGAGYATIATGVTDLTYVDATVETNETYYYVVSATNQFGASDDSSEVIGVGFPYDIIGTDATYLNNPALAKDNLFDTDPTTFFDGYGNGGWGGVDFGTARQVVEIQYTLRNWGSHAYPAATNATFEGANLDDFSDAVVLHTISTNAALYPAVNSAVVSNTASFRYVRLLPREGNACNFMAELNVVTTENIPSTTNGTLHSWLDSYYDVDTLFGGDYEAADLSDTDLDGHLAWEEHIAGTIPTDSSSVLRVNSTEATGGGLVITWQSVAGKNYSIITNANLLFRNTSTMATGISGLPTETSYTSSIPSAESLFFEVGVE
ncbi:Endo-1,4-beta-xylanase Z [Pontiella desulfatans]|uniref:Endo-1,4-beta-xylanase Z n=1 Tax=Pontiella desulfatans TaxID=2750659 RepID=A0A6C2TVP4_PONDE|nr:carbohydrate-binding protein [Pontiella desulfatans]VGO11728.1 Endo-1,4-beta-xylanase Z [Pontiella desulfatans]